jgi:hypothetical protein
MISLDKKKKAVSLRKEGYSFALIASELKISKSTAFNWTKSVSVKCKKKTKSPEKPPTNVDFFKNKRKAYQEEGRKRARDGDLNHAMACMLYWGEGCKKRNSCKITNTSPEMLKFFVDWLKTEFNLNKEDLFFRFDCYDSGDVDKIQDFWVNYLDLHPSCARKHIIKKNNGKYPKYPNGVCTVGIHDTRVVQHIFGAIQEYIKFEKLEFLE